jgi:PAS domain-containing protein
MSAQGTEVETLLGPLYAALNHGEGWTPFLDGLCAATGSHAGTLAVFEDGGGGSLPAFVGAGEAVAQNYEGRYAAQNPWRTSSGLPGAVRVSDDLMPWRELRQTDFWQDFLRPLDVGHGVGVVGASDGGRTLSLTMLRSAKAGVYAGDDVRLLERLAPHWLNASRLWSRLETVERPTRDLRAALDRLAMGVWLIDQQGRLIQTNDAGEQLLARGLMCVRNGHLTAGQPSDRANFAAAILAVARAMDKPQSSVLLHDSAGRAVAAAGMHRLMGQGTKANTHLLVFVRHLAAAPRRLPAVLHEVLRLTPAETDLAIALYQYRNLGRAAVALGIMPGAARTRMKTVLHKADVSNQAELLGVLEALSATG